MDQLRYPIGPFTSAGPQTAEERKMSIEELRTMAARLRGIIEPLSEEQLNTPYRPGGWSVKQVVHHLADNNMNAYLRFKRGLTEEAPEIPSYREDLWAELSDYSSEPVETSLLLLENLNRRFALVLTSLEEAQYSRTFVSLMLGTMTLDTALQRYNWHNRHHLAQITSLIERSGW
ncbi:YfiT family bacillithiol transferase [Paenibacillus sp. HW567]|uniref:YfiT family bacillithiol transferase n=1 Tax=Paenibacillus sp. HW567 TaxID=1034769 RepID=UPI00036596A0|nr:putative metal-dependent hydrolase [Paenibacillus sp. HW567]